jgi:hypothetical protein
VGEETGVCGLQHRTTYVRKSTPDTDLPPSFSSFMQRTRDSGEPNSHSHVMRASLSQNTASACIAGVSSHAAMLDVGFWEARRGGWVLSPHTPQLMILSYYVLSICVGSDGRVEDRVMHGKYGCSGLCQWPIILLIFAPWRLEWSPPSR